MMSIDALTSRLKGINKWISENPNITDPNMYEITEMTLELGNIARNENVGDMDGEYPKEGTKLYALYQEYYKMVDARFNSNPKKELNPLFGRDSEVYKLFSEMKMRATIGKQPEYADQEQFLLKKLSAIGCFIEQQKRDNAKVIYDNGTEYSEVKSLYEQFVKEHNTFMPQMKAMMEKIDHEYDLSINTPSKSWKDDVVPLDEVDNSKLGKEDIDSKRIDDNIRQ